MNLIKKIQENIFRYQLFPRGAKIVVGVSGGPDSVCLLDALNKIGHKNTKKELFKNRLKHYIEKYKDFLNEKTIHPISGEKSWTHEDLRRSVFCLIRHAPYLFTYKQNTHIPRTTNSLEGHFKHVKKMIAVHNGLSRPKTQKILTTIFLASTVSPNKKRLEEVL